MLSPLISVKVLRVVTSQCNDVVRYFSVSGACCAKDKFNFTAFRSARMMKKIMTGTKRGVSRPDHHPSKHLMEFGFVQGSGGSHHHKPVSGRVLRRVDMLNNLFVEQITSLLATGEVTPEFIGLGIQISKVKVTSDFSAVNVYWYASGTEKDEVIEKLLTTSSGHLRHALTQLRVIGIVPPIRFYKDKTFSKLQEVEMLLDKCGVSLQSPNAEDVVEESSSQEEKGCSALEPEDVMTHDILGVRHDRIMNEIKKALHAQSERQMAKERNRQIAAITTSDDADDTCKNVEHVRTLEEEVTNHRKRQHEFLKYLKQQQAEKYKALKRTSTEAKEQEFYRSVKDERKTSELYRRLDEMDDFDESDEEDETKYQEYEERYYENLRESFK